MNIKEKTILGIFWSAIERFGYTFIMFLSNLLLARLLTPDDFGIIGLLLVFIAVANIIVDGGFSLALIQKKNICSEDYSTAFYMNVLLAVFLYAILYFLAPIIAQFYGDIQLIVLLRILGVILIINALSVVQIAKIKRELNFKYLSIVSILSSVIGCLVGIIAAFYSMGVWSLVFQNLVISMIKSVVLFISSTWRPSFVFSLTALKEQLRFGSMVLFSNLVDTIYSNSISLIVGKAFSPKILGLYTQARTLESVPNNTIQTVVSQVTFPVFSRLQDNPEFFLEGMRKVARCLVWINFPLMVLLVLIAKPLFIILYTDKWVEAIPLFQIACCGGLATSLVQLNLSILLSRGYSRLAFFCRLFRQLLGFILIVFTIFLGNLYWMMIVGVACMPYLFLFISILYTKKIMPTYGFKKQLGDVIDIFLYSILCGIVCYILNYFIALQNIWGELFFQIFIYLFLYLIISKFFISNVFQYYWGGIKYFF